MRQRTSMRTERAGTEEAWSKSSSRNLLAPPPCLEKQNAIHRPQPLYQSSSLSCRLSAAYSKSLVDTYMWLVSCLQCFQRKERILVPKFSGLQISMDKWHYYSRYGLLGSLPKNLNLLCSVSELCSRNSVADFTQGCDDARNSQLDAKNNIKLVWKVFYFCFQISVNKKKSNDDNSQLVPDPVTAPASQQSGCVLG